MLAIGAMGMGMGRRWSETRASRPVIVEAGLIAKSLQITTRQTASLRILDGTLCQPKYVEGRCWCIWAAGSKAEGLGIILPRARQPQLSLSNKPRVSFTTRRRQTTEMDGVERETAAD